MKSLLKNSRNKRKSVNEKPNSASKQSSSTKSSSRSGSRLANSKALLDTRNRSTESEINEPSFARSNQGHGYQGLKPKLRESKASSTFIDNSRHSMDSQLYDDISEYQPNLGANNDNKSVISGEEPLTKPYSSPSSPAIDNEQSNGVQNATASNKQAINNTGSSNNGSLNNNPGLGDDAANDTNENNLAVPPTIVATPGSGSASPNQVASFKQNSSRKSSDESGLRNIDANKKDEDIKTLRSEQTLQDQATTASKTGSTLSQMTAVASSQTSSIPKLNPKNYDSVVFKNAWINRGSNMTSWSSSVTQDTWKLFRAELKGSQLNLYKPPSDLGIKHFEPKLAEPTTLTTPSQPPTSNGLSPVATITEDITTPATTRSYSAEPKLEVSEQATWTASSTSANPSSAANSRLPGGFPQNPDIKYISEVYPHPELQFEENNSVSNGSLEAICHAVLYNTRDNNELSDQLISVIPLFGDTTTAIGYFIQYASLLMSAPVYEIFKVRSKSFKFPLPNSLLAKKVSIISEATDAIVTVRLGLVVSIIKDQFPGMLMNQVIFERLLKLIELIGVHNEALSKDLTSAVISQQQKMTELLVFDAGIASNVLSRDEGKLSAEEFLKINLDEFSDQINLIDLRFNKEWNPKTDVSLLFETGYSYSRYNPLIFDPATNIHYLGRLLVQHLFEEEQSRMSIQFRAKVIQKWVELGSIFDKKGDMVSWLAIATVICSIPVLRLKKTWSVIDTKTLKIVNTEWGQVVFELDRRYMTSDAAHKSSYHVIAPQGIGESYSKLRVVPYFGDLAVRLSSSSMMLKQCEKRVQRVKISFNRWDEYLSKVHEKKDFGDLPTPNPRIQKLLYNLLNIHVALPLLTQEDVMRLSSSVEPSTSSSLYNFYQSSPDYERPPISTGAYFPILFTDFLPTYRVFDKEALIQAGGGLATIKRSTEISKQQAITGVNIIDYSAIHNHQKLKRSSPLANGVWDLLNISNDIFHVGNDLVFKAISNSVASEEGEKDASKPVVINVVAKASSFEKLMDILVLTPNIFSAYINEEDKQKYLQKHNLVGRNIKLDMDITTYTETFFASYKSFCSLHSLIEGLGRRFVGAKGAAISIKKSKDNKEFAASGKSFPDWDNVIDSSNPEINWKYVAQIEAGILEALHALICDFYADFTDDITIKQSFVEILKIIDLEISNEWKSVLKQHSDGADELYELYENLQSLYKKIRKYYIKRSYRPLDFSATPHTFSSVVDFPPDYAAIPISSQFAEIQLLVEKLDVVVYDLFRQTTVNEWIAVADLFEMQLTRSLTGIFSYKQPSPAISEEDLRIFNVFSWLESLHVDNTDVKLLSKFPSNIRALYGLHGKITSYFLNQIIEPRVPLSKRRNRMTTILQMLAIIRCRMNSCTVFQGSDGARIPAFLESCIAMAVCSPESRWFVNDWIYSSIKLHSKEVVMKWDTLSDLVPSFDSKILSKDYKSPLTPCFGWLAERLLEIGCYMPNYSVENPILLNFDKRRYTIKLINCLRYLRDKDSFNYTKEEVTEINRKFEFLYNTKRSVYDLRDIREVARKENKDYSRTEQKNKLFQKLVEVEFNKLKRDVTKREELELSEYKRKQAVTANGSGNSKLKNSITKLDGDLKEPIGIEKLYASGSSTGSPTLGSMSSSQSFHSTITQASSQPSSRSGGRFKLGGFLKSVRPFSINVGTSWSAPERVVSIYELPDPHYDTRNLKPAATFDMFTFKPLIIHSSDIEGFFKLISEVDGSEYCFQATSDAEAKEWFDMIATSKRYSYLSQSAKERNGTKVFGVPIQLVCERENGIVPYVVDKLLKEIELRGLNEVGLYRVPGAVANIQALKMKFDESASDVSLDDQKFLEINTLAGCFKLYLRELPESLLTPALLPSFVSVSKSENLVDQVGDLITQLPFHNYHLLRRLVFHLNQVTGHSDKNRMDASNLAMVFSMSFLSSADNDFARSLGSLQTILHSMIQEPAPFFKNGEYEAALK